MTNVVGVDDVESVFRAVLDQLLDYTARRISVHLVGPRASGRSEILRLAADRLDDAGWTVLRLHGNAAWRREPYSALSGAWVGPASPSSPRRSPGEIVAALLERLRGQVVLLCDDADDMDAQSVGALLATHRQRRLVAMTSSRPHRPVDAESLTLGLTPAVRVKAPVLGLDQIHELVRRLLGGPLDAGTLARITMKSGGLHGLAAAMASVGRQAGVLVERSGVWTAPGELWTEHLASAVEPFLAGADETLWNGATMLALAGPVPLDHAEKLIERPDLERLFVAGLVHHLTHDGRTLVGVYPPLLAEYLRREGSPFELAHAAELTDAPVAGGRSDAIEAGGADAAVRNLALVRNEH